MRTKFFPRKVIRAEKSLLLAAVSVVPVLVSLSTANANWAQSYNGSGSSIITLAVCGTGDVFAGIYGDGVFRSTNGGTSWTAVNNGLPVNSDVQSIAVRGTGNIFAGTRSGVFFSTNNGTNWTAVNNGLTDTNVLSLAVNDTGDIFVGTNRGGVFLSSNNGTSWTGVNNGLPANAPVWSFAVSGNKLFAGTNGGIFLSTNNGTSWTAVNKGLFPPALSLAVSGNNIFAGTSGGVYLSTNNGTSWTVVNIGLPANTPVQSIVVGRSLIFAGVLGKGIILSTDNCTSWTSINDGLTDTAVLSLALNDSTLFAGTISGSVWRRPLSEMAARIKLQLKVTYSYPGGLTSYHFVCDSVAGAAWYDLYGDDVQFLRLSHRPSFSRDSVEIGGLIDTIESKTGKTIKMGDTLSYYLVARSSANQVLSISNDISERFEYALAVRPFRALQKASGFRISGPLIDCSSLKGTVRVTLYSLSGEKLWEKSGVGIKTMVPDQLPRGVYAVEVIGSFGKASRVVVRE